MTTSGSMRHRSRTRSTSGGATCAAGRRSTPSTWRSWRTTCASRSRAWSTRGSPPTRRSWWRSSAWATSTRSRGSSRASTRTASGSSSSSRLPMPGEPTRGRARKDAVVAFGLAVAAAVAIKAPALFGLRVGRGRGLLRPQPEPLRAAPADRLFRLEAAARPPRTVRWLAGAFVAAGVFANVYPFAPGGSTEVLSALHLPIALWLAVGIAYAGGRWGQVAGRMDFIRFSGELFIYYVLIALGGGVLTGFMVMIFQAIGVDVEPFFQQWLLPCGAMGAVVDRLLAGGGQAERDREHGAGADAPLHAAVRRRAGRVPGDPAVDRARHRHRARTC